MKSGGVHSARRGSAGVGGRIRRKAVLLQRSPERDGNGVRSSPRPLRPRPVTPARSETRSGRGARPPALSRPSFVGKNTRNEAECALTLGEGEAGERESEEESSGVHRDKGRGGKRKRIRANFNKLDEK